MNRNRSENIDAQAVTLDKLDTTGATAGQVIVQGATGPEWGSAGSAAITLDTNTPTSGLTGIIKAASNTLDVASSNVDYLAVTNPNAQGTLRVGDMAEPLAGTIQIISEGGESCTLTSENGTGKLVAGATKVSLEGHAHAGSDITSGVVGKTYGGAGDVNGVLKANGAGTVSAVPAGGISDSLLTSNVPRKNASNTFTSTQFLDSGVPGSDRSNFGPSGYLGTKGDDTQDAAFGYTGLVLTNYAEGNTVTINGNGLSVNGSGSAGAAQVVICASTGQGTSPLLDLYDNAYNPVANIDATGKFTGNGSGLTALNGTNITSGTVAAARGGAGTVNGVLKADGAGTVSAVAAGGIADNLLTSNVPLKDANNTITGQTQLLKPGTDSTTTFQVQPSASATPVLNVDTTNSKVGIGTASPARALEVVNGDAANPGFRLSLASDPTKYWEWSILNGYTNPDMRFSALGVVRLAVSQVGNTGIGLANPTYSLHVAPTSGATAAQTVFVQDATAATGKTKAIIKAGAADTASDSLLAVQTNAGAALLDATAGGGLILTGTTATDGPTLGSELIQTANWSVTGGAGENHQWTADAFVTLTHVVDGVNHTATLLNSVAAVSSTKYQIAYTVTGRTAGSFTIAFGGQTSDAITATGTWGPTASNTNSVVVTPTADFDGTVVISIKAITAVSTALVTLKDSGGTARVALRASNSTGGTFVGLNSGNYVTTGAYNTAMGSAVLFSNTTGSQNTGQGYAALSSNTTGGENTGEGYYTLYSNTTGSGNTAVGNSAMFANTTGGYNAAIGRNSLYTNSTGAQNVAVGYIALNQVNAGFNTAVGAVALYTNSTGTNNVGLGYSAGRYETGSYAIYIDNRDRTNTAGDKAGAPFYAVTNATPASQTIALNGKVTALSLNIGAGGTKASNAAGTAGDISWDADYFYVCTAANTWERAALTGGY